MIVFHSVTVPSPSTKVIGSTNQTDGRTDKRLLSPSAVVNPAAPAPRPHKNGKYLPRPSARSKAKRERGKPHKITTVCGLLCVARVRLGIGRNGAAKMTMVVVRC